MRVYITGPVSGLPNLNSEAFTRAEALLESLGHEPVNPLKVFKPKEYYPTPNDLWIDAMKTDLVALLDCRGFVRLPGWEASRGSKLEILVSEALGLQEIFLPTT